MAQGYFQRPQDLLVRYGGEEFVLVSVGTARADMQKLLDAFVGLMANTEISAGEHHRSCTLSIGAYSDVPLLSLDSKTLLKRVDDALYQAKNQGRDQLVLIPALQPEPRK
jgi:diguanylate cyclase (GGDEF)-like protein